VLGQLGSNYSFGQGAIFAASVTAFLLESFKTLRPDSADTTVALLHRISDQLSQRSDSQLTPLPKPFRPSQMAIFCNVCWFISLILSLTSALGAILVRQWVLHFIQNAREEMQPHKRARMREYLFEGLKKWKLATVIESLPVMLHISLCLFMAGLIAFTSEADSLIMFIITAFLAAYVIIYTVLTLLPVWYPDCPYQTPLSTWCLCGISLMQTLRTRCRKSYSALRFPLGVRARRRMILQASDQRHELDTRAIAWLWSVFTEGREIEALLNAIPDFIRSFSEPLLRSAVPQTIVMKAIGQQIAFLVLESFRERAYGDHVRQCMENVVVAATNALSFAAYTAATQRSNFDWHSYLPPQTLFWTAMHRIALRASPSPPINPNFDLALRAHTFLLHVANSQLQKSRARPTGNRGDIATLRQSVYDRLHDVALKKHKDFRPFPELSELWSLCWLRDISTHEQFSYFGTEDAWFRTRNKYRLAALILDIDFLVLLLVALEQPWMLDRDLSDEQTQHVLEAILSIARHARAAFTWYGRKYTTQLRWFFNTLLERVSSASRPRLYKLLIPTCATILLDDGREHQDFQGKLRQRIPLHLTTAGAVPETGDAFLDDVRACLRLMDLRPTELHRMGACQAIDMPRDGDDLRCMLSVAQDSLLARNVLLLDVQAFSRLWVLRLSQFGTLRDLCDLIELLDLAVPPDGETDWVGCSPQFLDGILRFLDGDDIAYTLHFLGDRQSYLASNWMRLQLLQLRVQDGLSSECDGTAACAARGHHHIRETKRIGLGRVPKRRVSSPSLAEVRWDLLTFSERTE
jgi:hypothetical protein